MDRQVTQPDIGSRQTMSQMGVIKVTFLMSGLYQYYGLIRTSNHIKLS